MSRIDEKQELENYQNEVLNKAFETMSGDDIVYIEEDLRSFCTQEMAVFRAFADIVDQVEDAVVIIDTAPTGHTLLLLDATESYHKEVERTKGQTPFFVQRLLPRLRDAATPKSLLSRCRRRRWCLRHRACGRTWTGLEYIIRGGWSISACC